ncbi:MAG: hypothetical protein ACQERD_09090 [Campylobacterota bacterium]
MNRLFTTIFISFSLLIQSAFASIDKKEIKLQKKEILIGYYGRPNSKSLGILGETNIDELVLKMKKKKEYFNKELENKYDVKLAFHIIHSLATKDPGRRNDYLLGMQKSSVLKYIKRAQKEDFTVILDVQLGVKTPSEALKPLLPYLKYENVHLAIDPEFKIPTHRRYAPGKYVGHIFASDLNNVQKLISNYLIENSIFQKKKVIVHMFHPRMLREKQNVKNFDNIQLIYNIDGHGNSGVKVKIYNSLYNTTQMQKAISGFKIFYKTDKKPIMTPKEILGIKNVGSQKIDLQPYYINYH